MKLSPVARRGVDYIFAFFLRACSAVVGATPRLTAVLAEDCHGLPLMLPFSLLPTPGLETVLAEEAGIDYSETGLEPLGTTNPEDLAEELRSELNAPDDLSLLQLKQLSRPVADDEHIYLNLTLTAPAAG